MKAELLRGPAESALRLLGEALKSGWIFDCDVCQDLAVEFDAGFFQTVDERAVAHIVQFRGGSDADDPQRAVLALALFPAGVGELQSAVYGLFGRTVEF